MDELEKEEDWQAQQVSASIYFLYQVPSWQAGAAATSALSVQAQRSSARPLCRTKRHLPSSGVVNTQ